VSFVKVFITSLFCFSFVIAHQTNKSDDLMKFGFKAIMLSALTGAVGGVVDVVANHYTRQKPGIGLLPSFFIERPIRLALIRKLLLEDKPELDEQNGEKKRIVNSLGQSASWSGWILACVLICKATGDGPLFPQIKRYIESLLFPQPFH